MRAKDQRKQLRKASAGLTANPDARRSPRKTPAKKRAAPVPKKKPAAKRKKPKTSAATKARRSATAQKLIAGKSVVEVAKETGVSRATAYRDAASSQVRYQVAVAIDRHHKVIDQILEKSLMRLSQALDAKRLVVVSNGDGRQEIAEIEDADLAADHGIRIKAISQLAKLATIGRALPRDSEQDRPITFEQFQSLLTSFLGRRSI